MTVHLTPEQEQRVQAILHSGTYRTVEDVMEAALAAVEHDTLLHTSAPPSEGSGMIWEEGLLIYGSGTRLPTGFLQDALRRARDQRSSRLLGDPS